MTIKRLVLFFVLTPIAAFLAVSSLFGSLQEPQFQSRLELYQTNIALQAQAWQPEDSNDDSPQVIQEAILGKNLWKTLPRNMKKPVNLCKPI